MMVKIKEIKEENEDDEYVKSSNKSSTPLLLPRLANGRTSLCLLLWCWCFLVIIAFFFFFNLTRTLANVHFSRRTQGQRRRKMVCERDVCFSLSLVPLGVGLSRLDDQKKKITRVHLLCRHEQRFPRFTRAQSIGGHRESSSTGRTITTRNRTSVCITLFCTSVYKTLVV